MIKKGEPLNCSSNERKNGQVLPLRSNRQDHLSLDFSHYLIMSEQTLRSLSITEAEESVLVEMIQFFNDMGWVNPDSQTDYDSLTDKVCEPAFWEYK